MAEALASHGCGMRFKKEEEKFKIRGDVETHQA